MASHVYIMGTTGQRFAVKIGVCRRDPETRRKELQIGCPVPLEVLVLIPGGEQLERRLHAIFLPYRLHGEWFEAKGSLEQFVYFLLGGADSKHRVTEADLEEALEDVMETVQ